MLGPYAGKLEHVPLQTLLVFREALFLDLKAEAMKPSSVFISLGRGPADLIFGFAL